jgi:predicted Rossmann-fold nucleotide-binding protein
MDEFTEALVLIQTFRVAYFPVVLMGREYWAGLTDWMSKRMLKEHHYIEPNDLNVFNVVDEPQEAVSIISDFYKAHGPSGLKEPPGIKKPASD